MHMYANVIKIYHVGQEFCTFLLAGNGSRDGPMDLHSDYSADKRVMQPSLSSNHNLYINYLKSTSKK